MTFELPVSAAFVLLADQLTKRFVAGRRIQGSPAPVRGCVPIRYSLNPLGGGEFRRNQTALLLVWGFALVTLILFAQQGYYFRHAAAQAGLGLGLGGASSNLYDWLRHKAVIDFVKIGWWPAFNLADIGICAGAIAALVFMR
jgi:signal peptidase II